MVACYLGASSDTGFVPSDFRHGSVLPVWSSPAHGSIVIVVGAQSEKRAREGARPGFKLAGPGRTQELPAVASNFVGHEGPVSMGGPALPRVLIVDDNQDAAEMLGEVLRELGHEVAIAHDGLSALTAAGEFGPTAAVLDIGLPLLDGYELARRLRGNLPGIRLVAVTGYGQERDRSHSRAAGFHAHLVKPVDINALTKALTPADGVAQGGRG
jgi:CheY-like chemotaxis protein